MRLYPSDWRRQAEPIPVPTRVNLGPLTTAFVPPPHCSRAALAGSQAVLGQSCNPVNDKTASAADDTGCWPRATAYPSAAKSKLNGLGFYSPGLTCPQGHYSACTAVSTAKGQTGVAAPQVTGKFQFPLVAGETAVGCCPTGYTCGADGGFQTCHQVATQTKFDAMTCSGLSGSNLDGFQVPVTMGGETVATMDLWAPMIQINHMATDLPETSTAASATAGASIGSSQTAEASSSRAKGSAAASATATAADKMVKVMNVGDGEASTSTAPTKTQTSDSASASASDDVVKVKDTSNEEPRNNTSSHDESSSKASKTGSATGQQSKATATSASGGSPLPTIDWSAATEVPEPHVGPNGIVFDTRKPPSMTNTLFPSPTAAVAASATASPTPDSTPTSFSTGAKVGVACAPIAGAALILLGIFYYKRRRQSAGSYKDGGDAKSISSDSSGPSTYQSTYFGGNASTAQVHKAGMNDTGAYSTPRSNSPYNEDHTEHEMAMNGPGPAVIAPAGYGNNAQKMTPADFYANPWTDRDEYETRPFETAASRFKHAHSLSDDANSIESPIDGSSPFRLKRKSTLKGRDKLEKRITGQANNERHVSMEGSIVTPNPERDSAEHDRSSEESVVQWDEKSTLQRSTSFSRPRPRPKTAASSLYPDDRDSIMSWDAAMAPEMPDKPLPSIPEKGGLDRSKSFSRPRPKRDESADTLVEVEGEGRATTPVPKGVVAPPVTAEGVSF